MPHGAQVSRNEIEIRQRLSERRPLDRALWLGKTAQATKVLEAHDRLNQYIADTQPAERLPGRAVQADMFDQEGR